MNRLCANAPVSRQWRNAQSRNQSSICPCSDEILAGCRPSAVPMTEQTVTVTYDTSTFGQLLRIVSRSTLFHVAWLITCGFVTANSCSVLITVEAVSDRL